MKKFAAIILFVLLLFNTCGYRMVSDWLQNRAEKSLQTVIDNGRYDSAKLVELSVITNLPYTNDWLQWEHVKGTIEIDGYQYQYVERKLEKGKMFYRCLPNSEKQTVLTARNEFSQLVNNFNQLTNHKSSSKSIVISNYIGDYDDAVANYTALKPLYIFSENNWPTLTPTILIRQIPTLNQPPDC